MARLHEARSPKWVFERFGKPHRRQFTKGSTSSSTSPAATHGCRRCGCCIGRVELLTCGATAGFDPKEDIRYIWTFELQILGSNGWMREDIGVLFEMIPRES